MSSATGQLKKRLMTHLNEIYDVKSTPSTSPTILEINEYTKGNIRIPPESIHFLLGNHNTELRRKVQRFFLRFMVRYLDFGKWCQTVDS